MVNKPLIRPYFLGGVALPLIRPYFLGGVARIPMIWTTTVFIFTNCAEVGKVDHSTQRKLLHQCVWLGCFLELVNSGTAKNEMKNRYLNPPVGSEIWAPKNPPKTDLGLKFDTQTEGYIYIHVLHCRQQIWNDSMSFPLAPQVKNFLIPQMFDTVDGWNL